MNMKSLDQGDVIVDTLGKTYIYHSNVRPSSTSKTAYTILATRPDGTQALLSLSQIDIDASLKLNEGVDA